MMMEKKKVRGEIKLSGLSPLRGGSVQRQYEQTKCPFIDHEKRRGSFLSKHRVISCPFPWLKPKKFAVEDSGRIFLLLMFVV